MGDRYRCVYVVAVAFLVVILSSTTSAYTNSLQVEALQDFYKALNYPAQLKGWTVDNGGDPCEESWTGVSCSGSSVIYLNLHGLNLTGYLGGLLHNLHDLKELDVGSNNISGEIPTGLPPNATHLNMACNKLSESIPHSLSSMSNLHHLNLSHNSLSGHIGNVFTGLQNLKEMDLSNNNFTGDLPISFESLTNLSRLFLQSNKLTGSVIYLANLPLYDLDIHDNDFSGVIPGRFQLIPNLWFGGNRFHIGANTPHWHFPLEDVPMEQNISSPPTTEYSAIEKHPPASRVAKHKRNRLGPAGIACMIGGAALMAAGAALFFVVHVKRPHIREPKASDSSNNSLHSLPVSTARDYSCSLPEELPQILSFSPPPFLNTSRVAPLAYNRTENHRRKSFSKKSRFPANVKVYSVAELQSATSSFGEENLLGEGSLGSVYKAEFPDGQIFAVKNIKMVSLSFKEEEHFLDVVRRVSRLKHPNIVKLHGYCLDHGQHLLVYEYIRNISLDDALHSEGYKPLSWGVRLRIALGVAQAIDYLHSGSTHPIAHGNLKSTNILLDEEFKPHVCDCVLAVLRPLTSNSVKVKASEIALDDTGYITPEHGQPGFDSTKNDTYAFGVLLLELLTGRRTFDNSRPWEEQYLVKWASSQLHDNESLKQMADPGIKSALPSKALSRFADIVSLCIQPDKEHRPQMSEILESLKCLTQRAHMGKCSTTDGLEADPLDTRSFRSTHTRFLGSPASSFPST